MRVSVLTREYPPFVYGGAGVHVDFLVRELRRLIDVDVLCLGEERDGATSYAEKDPRLGAANSTLHLLSADVAMAAGAEGSDVVHSHTWYANMAGHFAKLLYDVPHVVTAHSLEPQRPWKAEQLGGGYRVSSWAERTAYEAADAVVAVSAGMRADILEAYPSVDPAKVHVIYNGIDTELYAPDEDTDVLERHRRRPDPALHRLRRAHHPAEGRAAPAAGRAAARPGGAAGAAGRRGRHPGAGRRDRRGSSRSCAAPATASSWSRRCCRARTCGRC